jgi:putative hydrolase of the HAD superfamily
MAHGMARMPTPVDCVLFDLDDTLYEHVDFLRGAFADVAAAVDPTRRDALAAAMLDIVSAEGADGGRIFERALARVGHPADARTLDRMAVAFHTHAPDVLPPAAGVRHLLGLLAARFPLGLVTDGDVVVQRAKLRALRLADRFRVVVLADSLGGPAMRKPHPAPYRAALDALGARAAHSVFVGDHPGRDVAGARALGMTTVRVLTGEHRDRAVEPDAEADFVLADLRALEALFP